MFCVGFFFCGPAPGGAPGGQPKTLSPIGPLFPQGVGGPAVRRAPLHNEPAAHAALAETSHHLGDSGSELD